MTLTGTLVEGIRPSCRVLATAAGRYALTGLGDAALQLGDVLTVTGKPAPHLISPCGRTFVVSRFAMR